MTHELTTIIRAARIAFFEENTGFVFNINQRIMYNTVYEITQEIPDLQKIKRHIDWIVAEHAVKKARESIRKINPI